MCADLTTPDRQVFGVAGTVLLTGMTEKAIRQRVARKTMPFRKLGSRVIFLREELEAFLRDLPGCTLEEAQKNLEVRRTHELD